MATTSAGTKLMQSSRISQVGCFGLVLVVVLLILIGAVAARHEINMKRAAAVAAYQRLAEQAEKAPGILNRMLAFDCGDEAASAVGAVGDSVAGLSTLNEPSISRLKETWGQIEDTWGIVSRGCAGSLSSPAFRDLTTEIEGIRNRYSVEMGNFEQAAQIYDLSLDSFPGNIVAKDFKKIGE
ncbi:MAG: hypothetical protein NTY09_11770 [bacterium]|nr:hypothetical protein [bacterium]